MDNDEALHYLELTGDETFRYAASSGLLTITAFFPERIVYEGPLEKRLEQMEKEIEERERDAFRQFYTAIEKGEGSFSHTIKLRDSIRRITCKAVTEDNGDRTVYGVIHSEKKDFLNELTFKRASDKDPMLNMLSKSAITEYAQQLISRHDCPATFIVMFDLDHFKMVNDTYGHVFGDEVLIHVTEVINKAVGANGVVGRVGGDEIMIITRGIADKASLRPMLREIRMNIEEDYAGKLGSISLTCSMGAAAYPDHGDSYKSVLQLADKMLYLAKEKGRNRYVIYTPEMHQDLLGQVGNQEGAWNLSASFDKIGIIHYMLENYIVDGATNNEVSFANVGRNFNLSEILIVYESGKVGFRWTPESTYHNKKDLRWLTTEESFFSDFDKNDLFVVDWLDNLKDKHPELQKKLMNRDIQSALFYRLKDKGETKGFIMFARKEQRQKWSEYELLALSTIAKVFELSVYR
ncbi:MAG: GGDEF domain-containing protein [Lachnospiraceae bacterium]|nr:GGDEF domain-containing protein [Lachnospiraceae bacterium]